MNTLRRWAKGAVVGAWHARNESRRRRMGLSDGALPPELWDLEVNAAGHLAVCGHDTVELGRRYGTPLHVVNRPRLIKDFRRFVDAFRGQWPDVQVGYSYKTNPLPGVIRELHAVGAWAEVISQFELWLALKLGVPSERIIYNGPAKSPEALRLAISSDVRLINVDNLGEIDQIGTIARELGKQQEVGVRVVTSVGWSGQFGHSLADGEAREAFARLTATEGVVPCGLHAHLGTGLKDVETYLRAIREILDFARTIEQDFRLRIRYLDFGGGFGVPTVRPLDRWDARLVAMGYPAGPIDLDKTPTIEAFAQAIGALLRQYYPGGDGASLPTLLFEPGRAITSSAQMLLLSVLALKRRSSGSTRAILDGGKNIAIPTGYELHELLPASAMNTEHRSLHDFYGPLCHPGDILQRNKQFPELQPGDLVALMDAGAYFVPNQMNFSNPRPAAIMVDPGSEWLIRSRESFDNIVQLDHLALRIPPCEPMLISAGHAGSALSTTSR